MMRRWKSKSVCEADGKPDLDLLEADVDQRLEQRQLALGVHGVDQRLVAVAQVDAGPARGPRELAVGPGAVAQHERHVRAVLAERHGRRVAGQGQATPLHVVTTPFLSLSHVVLPFFCLSRCPSARAGAGPTKNPLAIRRRRLRANAMWRSPSGKQQVGRGGFLMSGAIVPSQRAPASRAPPPASRNAAGCRRGRCGPPPRRRTRGRTGRSSPPRRPPATRRAGRRRRRRRCRPRPARSRRTEVRARDGSGCGHRPGRPWRSRPVDVHREAQGLVVRPHGVHVRGGEDGGDALEGGHGRSRYRGRMRRLLWTLVRAALVIAVLARRARRPARPGAAARAPRRRAGHRQPRHVARGAAQAASPEAIRRLRA